VRHPITVKFSICWNFNRNFFIVWIKISYGIDASLYTILQVLSVTPFEKTPLFQLLSDINLTDDSHTVHNQLNLFDY